MFCLSPVELKIHHRPHPLSTDRVLSSHQSLRRLESCGDTSPKPCYECMASWGAKYCKYTKAFKMYKCCQAGDTDGICSSSDSDVQCSDQFQSFLKYQVCYRDSLQCGSEYVFMVNSTMETSTTEFFDQGGICYFKLRTYEDNDQVYMNITFTQITNSEAYIMYKKNGWSQYAEERIEMAPGENVTYQFKRADLSDKDIYVISKAVGGSPKVKFNSLRIDIPATVPDNSLICTIAVSIFSGCCVYIMFMKMIEYFEYQKELNAKINHENIQFSNRLGIDFEMDRARLDALARSTRSKFTTACLKYKNVFRN